MSSLILHVSQWCNLRQIHVAWNGEEALITFGTGTYEGKSIGRPKVILLDLKLPKVDGLSHRKIKSEPATHSIPVVIFTSSREERDIVESYALGVNSYIVKPVQFDQFANVIRDLASTGSKLISRRLKQQGK